MNINVIRLLVLNKLFTIKLRNIQYTRIKETFQNSEFLTQLTNNLYFLQKRVIMLMFYILYGCVCASYDTLCKEAKFNDVLEIYTCF